MLFDISRYLIGTYIDIVWGFHPPRDPLKSIFEMPSLGWQCFLTSVDI